MSDKTTATERLRQLLDERGVEWQEHVWGGKHSVTTLWHARGVRWHYRENRFDELRLHADGLTPEQAVEATLGRGTCRKVRAWEDDPRGGGGWVLVCSECDELLANDGEDGEFDGPNYCPNCGRKVEQ